MQSMTSHTGRSQGQVQEYSVNCFDGIAERIKLHGFQILFCIMPTLALKTLQFFTQAKNQLKTSKQSHHWRKITRARGEMRIIITVKGRIRNLGKGLFDVVVLQLIEADVDLIPRYGTITMGQGRSVDMEPWMAGCATGTKIY